MKKHNWLFRFLGLHDREQKQRTEAVSVYADQKMKEYSKQMSKVKALATKVQKNQAQVYQETVKLVSFIDDVTAKIMRASGGTTR